MLNNVIALRWETELIILLLYAIQRFLISSDTL